MVKGKQIYTVILFLFTCLVYVCPYAQSQKKPVVTAVPKFKPPITKTYLGKYSGINATCTVEEGKQLITLLLKITDDKNNAYKISSYQFAYTRKGVTEDEDTGKISPQSDMVADRFMATPLPAIWQTNIAESLHKGEELYFFDVIVFDQQNRLFFAPELKITIQ
jgi:hypothetical protein